MTLLIIALGGAFGAVLRYLVSKGMHHIFGINFPYGTLTVNVLGSFVIGFIAILLFDRLMLGSNWRAFLIIGFLGAFTTFSSFSIETLNLFENGAVLAAGANILLNVILCLVAVYIGVLLGRQL